MDDGNWHIKNVEELGLNSKGKIGLIRAETVGVCTYMRTIIEDILRR